MAADLIQQELLLRELRDCADPAYRERIRDLYRMEVEHFLGVRTPAIRKLAAAWHRPLRRVSLDALFMECEKLLDSGWYECRIIAFDWAFRRRQQLLPGHLDIFERWLMRYVDDWIDCDDLCTHGLGYLLLEYEACRNRPLKWTGSHRRWARRAAAVSLIYGLRRGKLFEEACEVARHLLGDDDPLVQKGAGWMLKEASRHFPSEVLVFVLDHRDRMPRTMLRYAIEKLPESQRKRVLA